jgi:hypothetical protein
MPQHTNSRIRRAFTSLRRTWADMERAQRRVIELQMDPYSRRSR